HPGLSVAVEDTPNGIRSAASANLRVIMVPDVVMTNLELRELTVTVQSDLFGVQKFLEKFGDL
ncbi:MAG: HAD family phosphatase, partial [Ruminococcus sp.]